MGRRGGGQADTRPHTCLCAWHGGGRMQVAAARQSAAWQARCLVRRAICMGRGYHSMTAAKARGARRWAAGAGPLGRPPPCGSTAPGPPPALLLGRRLLSLAVACGVRRKRCGARTARSSLRCGPGARPRPWTSTSRQVGRPAGQAGSGPFMRVRHVGWPPRPLHSHPPPSSTHTRTRTACAACLASAAATRAGLHNPCCRAGPREACHVGRPSFAPPLNPPA